MISTVMTVGEKNKYFTFDHYKFIGNERLEERILSNSKHGSVDPYDYQVTEDETASTNR